MWQSKIELENGGRIQKITLWQGEQQLTYAQVVNYWQQNGAFRTFYSGLIADAPFTAVFWEAPPITKATMAQPYEFVLVEAVSLGKMPANPRPFQQYFHNSNQSVIAFENLGRDAMLVVPCPTQTGDEFTHLAKFVREAPAPQTDLFWQMVGQAVAGRVSDKPMWVNTSGMGVFWLHVRLDSRPKYYTYGAYRNWQ